MKNIAFLAAAVMLAATPHPAAAAEVHAKSPISVSGAWARPAPLISRPAAAYVHIANRGTHDDVLEGASSPDAKRVEIHLTSMANGVMKMRKAEPLALPAGKAIVMKPGGYHVMIMGLRRTLKPGDTISVSFSFKRAGTIALRVPVRLGAASGGGGPMHGGGHGR